MIKPEQKKKVFEFLNNIKGKAGLFTHSDADGVCSAALVLKYLKQQNIEADVFCGQHEKEKVERFISGNYGCFIFLDFCLEEYIEIIDKLKRKKVLIIDHHPSSDLSRFGFVHINPRFSDPNLYISASEVCFEILKSKKNMKDCEWLGRLGGVGDKSLEGTDEEEEANELIASVKAVRKEKGLLSLIEFLADCKELKDFAYEERFQKFKKIIQQEIDKQISFFEIYASGNIVFFQLRSRYSILSTLINRLFDLYPKKTLVFYRVKRGFFEISGRSSLYNIGEIFNKVCKKIPDSHGGGHSKAGGARVSDFKMFRKLVEEEIKKTASF